MTMSKKSCIENQFWPWRGYKIHFIKAGKTNHFPPLLLVHGFGSSTDQWVKNIVELKNEFEVWAIDLLGFGRSTKADTEYSLNLWCDQIKDFISEVIGAPVVIIGNSIGGYMALVINSMFPIITCGAILLNPVGCFNGSIGSSATYYRFFQKIIDKSFNFLLSKSIISSLIFKCLRNKVYIRKILQTIYLNRSEVTEELVDNICRPMYDLGAEIAFFRLSQIPKDRLISISILLKKLNHPLFLIWGKHDSLIPNIQRIRRQYTQEYPSALDMCIEAGHCPHDDAPQIVNGLMRLWLLNNIKSL